MSSYLTFYGIPTSQEKDNLDDSTQKNENIGAKLIQIASFSRNNDIYSYFYENCDIAFCYDETKYSDITKADVDNVEADIMTNIKSSERRLNEYEKHADSNPDYISEILSIKEYLEDLYRALHYTEFIGHIVRDAEFKYSGGFEKIVANID